MYNSPSAAGHIKVVDKEKCISITGKGREKTKRGKSHSSNENKILYNNFPRAFDAEMPIQDQIGSSLFQKCKSKLP